MPIVRFEQNFDAPAGEGNFFDDKGRAIYAFDPETAARFNPGMQGQKATPEPEPPAATPFVASDAQLDSAAPGVRPAAQGAPDMRVAGPGGGSPAPPASSPALQVVGKLDTFNRSTQKGVDPAKVKGMQDENTRIADESISAREATAENRIKGRTEQTQAQAGSLTQGFFDTRQQNMQTEEQLRANELQREALAMQKDPEVDPNRVIGSMSTGRLVLTAIMAGLTNAFHKAGGGKGNVALDIVNKSIDDDIASQVKAIESGRASRGNMIAMLRERGFDLKQAKAAERARLSSMAERMAELQSGLIGFASEQRAGAQDFATALRANTAQANNELTKLTLDRETVTSGSQTTRAAPKAAVQSPEDVYKTLQIQNMILDQADASEIGKVIGRNLSPRAADRVRKEASKMGEDLTKLQPAKAMFMTMVRQTGATVDPKTGRISWPADDDLKGVGPLDARPSLKAGPAAPLAKAANMMGLTRTDFDRVNQERSLLKEYVAKDLTGAAYNDLQDAAFTAAVGGDMNNEGQFKQAAETMARKMWGTDASIRAKSEDAARVYDWQITQQAERNSGGGGFRAGTK